MEADTSGNDVPPSNIPESSSRHGQEDETYNLARDRPRRQQIQPHVRNRQVDNISTIAFMAAEEDSIHEPLTFSEAIQSEDSDKWLVAM